MTAAAEPLILASRSPQRAAILEQLGIRFEARPVDFDERSDGEPEHLVIENARGKAAVACAAPGAGERLVVGVDTLVAVDGQPIGKPETAAEAWEFLQRLGGRTHEVLSGLSLVEGGHEQTAVARTAVTFRQLPHRYLHWYVDSEEWRGRAGGYAIQGRGAALVARVEGDYLNVVGLPVATLLDLRPDLAG